MSNVIILRNKARDAAYRAKRERDPNMAQMLRRNARQYAQAARIALEALNTEIAA